MAMPRLHLPCGLGRVGGAETGSPVRCFLVWSWSWELAGEGRGEQHRVTGHASMPGLRDRAQQGEPLPLCGQCGKVVELTKEQSSGQACRCWALLDEGVELRERDSKRRSSLSWAAGRVGDVDFTSPNKTRGKFVRVRSSTDPALIYRLLTEQWGLDPPHLAVSLVGGRAAADEAMAQRHREEGAGAWILTNGLRFGITKHLGQAVRDHSLASTSHKVRVVAIGITPWGTIHNRDLLLSAKPEHPAVYPAEELPYGAVYSLDSNHSHFVLVEDDPECSGSTNEMRVKLLKYISQQRTGYGGTGSFEIPVLCLLVHGEPKILQRMHKEILNSTPWLILAGSGGVADILVDLMNRGCWDTSTVQELLLDTFHGRFHGSDITKWAKLIQKIVEHRHLLTVHDPEQESSELDTVILKALVKACKSQSQEAQDFLDELKLAVAWNHVDIAKSEIFNGDVEWRACDLEEVMMDALVNDKPDFVRLFVDNGVNLGEFLTYGRLQELYCSVSEKSLLHDLLLKKHEEKQVLLATARAPGPPQRAVRPPLHPPRGLQGEGEELFHSQKGFPDMEEKGSENPWGTLPGPEAVATALAGCKILKEMAHLESEAESARSMKDAKYEQFALDLFSECYSNSEDRAYALLVRKTRYWSKCTVLDLATEADAKFFFAHDGVQALLTKIWWGSMTTDTAISKLVLCFFFPPLIWTNLVKFRTSRRAPARSGPGSCSAAGSGSGAPRSRSSWGTWSCTSPSWSSSPTSCSWTSAPAPNGPSVAEIILYFWVFTLVLEELRQSFFTDEDTSILKKFKLYVEDNWNKCDMVAILLFVVGVSCRMVDHIYEAGRTVLALDFMVFTLRLIHIFAIHKQLGPKIIIVERMMKDVFFFLFFLSVWLIAYGVATQALLHPNDPRLDWVFRRALYRPYLHIFGQIPLEEIDAARMPEMNCTTELEEILAGTLPPCPNIYANWLVILLLVIYLLVTNVLLLNLLIAMFSYTFQVVQENADIFWKFQRYNLIVEYHGRPALAPPFIIISHCHQLLLCLANRTESKQEHLERELPPGLDQKLMTWESVQKENYLAKLEQQQRESSEERLKSTSSKVQALLRIAGGYKEQEKRFSAMESQVKYCTEVLSWMAECFAQSTLSRGTEAPDPPAKGLQDTGPARTADKEGEPGSKEAKAGPQEAKAGPQEPRAGYRDDEAGYGANKKLPYIDE
ncbi:hypothetical protein ANANG_G00201140 [Anguilla anguilla]|uniref:Transient receptor potential cation channel subfamily M member 5 n=1 Tax=Anguilla anguilla TaxID=7936 RepID=A0A9D3M1J8_ANGAN|nr:hypothetical protein ANANG_G00201140 [Anguilla anguilla]